MRIVFIGASSLNVTTSKRLINAGHEVIIIEINKDRIDDLAETLDCGFIHGDGTRPDVLREAAPEKVDVLYCLTKHDQGNIIASLVARSLGIQRVVTMVSSEDFEHIAIELGLEHIILPNRTISRHLVDMLTGQDALEISAMIKGDARLFSFVARDKDEGTVEELDLPKGARAICCYRDGSFKLTDPETTIKTHDELIVLTHSEHLEELRERWSGGENSKTAV